MHRDVSGIFSLVIKCFGITNTSVQNFAIRISSVKTVPKCLRKLIFFNKFDIHVSSLLMSSLRAIVICQNYCGNRVMSSKIHLSALLLNMRRCTLCLLSYCVHALCRSLSRCCQNLCIMLTILNRLYVIRIIQWRKYRTKLKVLKTMLNFNFNKKKIELCQRSFLK